MELEEIILQIGVIFAGGFLVVAAGWFVLKDRVLMGLRPVPVNSQAADAILLPLRLQAYERLTVFVDRINPVNLLIRLHQPEISADGLQTLVLNEIRQEFQHNITQQLYVSTASWEIIKKLKEDTLIMFTNVRNNLPESASGVDISKKILQQMATLEENPYELTIGVLKAEIQKLF